MRTSALLGVLILAGCGVRASGQATTAPPPPSPASRTTPPTTPTGAVPSIATGTPARARGADGVVLGPNRAGWWNDAVFYEVFVRSFADSSSGALANDGIGDIPGLIEKLDYLNDGDPATTMDLGVTGLWLMPIHPSPSYHGYDVKDYRGVNPQYGTLEDFRRLVAACHKRGIRVILDMVLNHCSDENPWFVGAADPASPKHDWFIWADADPGWKGPWKEQVWHKVRKGGDKPLWYYGIFSGRMPDLNYRNAQVSEEMLRVTDFWVDKEHGVGADGYRLDAVRHLVEDGQVQENTPETHAWLKKFHAELKRANPEGVSIGEVWTSSEVASSYVGDELDMTFEFDLSFAMVEAAKTGKAQPVIDAQAKVLRCYRPNQYGRFLTNHDQARVLTALKGDGGAMRSAAALMLLGPGVPFIYYGEELGMIGDKPDENLRRPMRWTTDDGAGFTKGKPWEGMGKEPPETCVASETGDAGSLLAWYRRLIALRKAHGALAHGGYAPVRTGNPGVIAFVRTGEEPVLVIVNLTGEPVREYALEGPEATLKGSWVVREALHGGKPGAGGAGGAGGADGPKPIAELAAHEAYALVMTARPVGAPVEQKR